MIYQKRLNVVILGMFAMFLCTSIKLNAQEFSVNTQNSSLLVYGTSNIHDWEIETENQSGVISLETANELQIKKLNFTVEVESLKSGKNGMDKNTYKALDTKNYKTIEFQLVSTEEITDLKDGNFKVKTKGDLKIAGVTKRISLDFNLNINKGTVKLVGEKSLKMTDYKVSPPTALLGTIKTGDEVTIKFNTILK
ncbi:YceI family protein [Polaribacter undariae]|uniref:YceI family protein n=1 Tax=Polaribacter sejongensis TaxID=985043 RepID=A0AAJ1QW33_9FLAO|nr:YceI family protein [Polaribacter undariae]MDN3619210.1 YceI family protein [Polaribacter undariae]UWD33589.1 YceI family protein [Polaribacter undariae]